MGRLLPASGDLLHDSLFIHRQSKGLAHAQVIQRLAFDVETKKIGAQVIEGVTVRLAAQPIHQLGRNQGLVPDNIGLPSFVEIHGQVG